MGITITVIVAYVVTLGIFLVNSLSLGIFMVPILSQLITIGETKERN